MKDPERRLTNIPFPAFRSTVAWVVFNISLRYQLTIYGQKTGGNETNRP
jgi:hypothetical protein